MSLLVYGWNPCHGATISPCQVELLYYRCFSITYPIFSGIALAVFPLYDDNIIADIFITSPMTTVDLACLSFRYFLKSQLIVSVMNASESRALAIYDVDGGFEFHYALIDLPRGSYQIVWQIKSNLDSDIPHVNNYRFAIDDIILNNITCKALRK